MRQKDFESSNVALVVHGRSKDKNKKREKGRSKSRGRPKSLGKSKGKCWNCGKVGNFKRDCKEQKKKNKKEKIDFYNEYEKSSQEDGGDSFVVALETHAR